MIDYYPTKYSEGEKKNCIDYTLTGRAPSNFYYTVICSKDFK